MVAWILRATRSCSRKNSLTAVLKACGVWELVLLMLISWNLEHGPRQDAARRIQFWDGLNHFYQGRTPQEMPMFMAGAPAMIKQLEDAGVAEFPREKAVELELWDWLVARNHARQLGRRTSAWRYGALMAAHRKNAPYWEVQSFERSVMAMETDVLKGKKLIEKVTISKADSSSAAGDSSTTPTGIQLEGRPLRSMASNAVGVSVMTLVQPDNKRVLDIMLIATCAPMDAFHTRQNRDPRDVFETEDGWLHEAPE